MKLTFILVTVVFMNIYANGFSQTVTYSGNNVSMETVFSTIREQTGYVFFYNKSLLKKAKPITLNVIDVQLKDVLALCFKGQPLDYSIKNKTIVIGEKNKLSLKNFPDLITIPIEIKGKVLDENGEPLPGVTVQVKGTEIGVSTSLNGTYTLNVPDDRTGVLVFKFIGMQQQEVSIGNKTIINITMIPALSNLNEVVVVGYGTQKRSEVIGSVSQIRAKDINDRTTPQLQQALTGQLAGVTVIQRSGQPGAPGGSIQIRGVGSFGAGTAPLILVDGIPVIL